jgi:hypothetical protein
MLKNKWVWIGIVLVICVGMMIYGTSTSVCEPPCV